MIYENNAELRRLVRAGVLGDAPMRDELLHAQSYVLADVDFDAAVAEVKAQHTSHSHAEAEARAAYRLLTSTKTLHGDGAPAVPMHSFFSKFFWSSFWSGQRVWACLRVAWAIAILAMLLLLAAQKAHGQEREDEGSFAPHHSALRTATYRTRLGSGYPVPDVPGGVIIQVSNQGTVLATRPAGLLKFDCSTNLTCSFSGVTFTLTASSSASTAWSALTASTNSNAGSFAGTGNTWDFTAAALFKLRVGAGCTTTVNGDRCYDSTNSRWLMWQGGANKNDIAASNLGTTGQPCLSNSDGSCTFADPIVSGPDAVGVASTKNPVQIGCVFLTTPATLTNNQVGAMQCDANQNHLVKVNNTVIVTGTVTTTPPANASTNLVQLNGTTVDTNSGTKSAGTLRVVLATDQPQLTNKLLVTPDSVALPANQSVNVNQFAGSAAVTGTGAGGAGIPRVTVSNDSSLTGTLSNNGAAAASNRVGILPCIAQTDYNNGAAATQGRDAALNCGTDGLTWVAALPAMRPASYTASAKFAASSTTDNAVLPGNATNTVLVTEVRLSCVQTTAGIINVEIAKRSAADTSGTSAAMTVVPDDSNYSAASSAPLSYTGAGPTAGTLVGDIDNNEFGCMAPGTATANDIYVLNLRQKPVVLRGTAQQLAVNLGGALTGGTMTVTFKWIETKTITP